MAKKKKDRRKAARADCGGPMPLVRSRLEVPRFVLFVTGGQDGSEQEKTDQQNDGEFHVLNAPFCTRPLVYPERRLASTGNVPSCGNAF